MTRTNSSSFSHTCATSAHTPKGSPAKRSGNISRSILGVPARFMTPRMVLVACALVLTTFGLLMVYSASSVMALTSQEFNYDATYLVKRQAIAAAIGFVAVIVLSILDYHLWTGKLAYLIWGVTVVLLALVVGSGAGQQAMGATRWVLLAGIQFQPTEFAKAALIIALAAIAERYYETQDLPFWRFVLMIVVAAGAIFYLVVRQPDKGSFAIMAATLLAMGFLAGVPTKLVLIFVGLGVLGVTLISLMDEYSRQRIHIIFDPFSDAGDTGYHLVQSLYAFGSGGLFGTGIGTSSQKYSYLPYASIDFIFAVVGEELGLVGTLLVLGVFAAFVWAGYDIAKHAPDMAGRLIAGGATSLIWFQLVINLMGVLGMLPLTGKPVPFLSYGGSSILATLILVGLILSVSVHSSLPETVYDEKREQMLKRASLRDFGLSYAGEAQTRTQTRLNDAKARLENKQEEAQARKTHQEHPSYLRVVEGGQASEEGVSQRKTSARTRVSTTSDGRTRIDMGPSAAERLRRETQQIKEEPSTTVDPLRLRKGDSRGHTTQD